MRTSSVRAAARLAGLLLLWLAAFVPAASAAGPPNIVVIYADDLGYGDVSAYGATAIATPSIDRIAAQGLRFTDAHAPAATCTPSVATNRRPGWPASAPTT